MIGPPRRPTLFPSPPLSQSTKVRRIVAEPNPLPWRFPADRPHLGNSRQFGIGVRTGRALVKARIVEEREHRKWRRHMLPDRKSTRLNSSHSQISYAVFCLKK